MTQVYTPNAGDGLKRLEERQIWDVKYAEYLAELDKEKPSLQLGTTTLPTRKLTLPTQPATAVHQDSQTKNVKDLQIFWPKDLQIPFVTYMVMFLSAILGGHNEVKPQKSTIRAGESTIG